MKTKRFATIFVSLVILGAPLTALELKVTRISVTGTETTDPALVREAFLEVAVGDTLAEAALEEAARLAQNRLISLGYFGSVEVLVVRSKNTPGTAALVAEVTEAFPGRFGGGPVWGRAGIANMGGQGQDVDLWLGVNRQALGWSGRWAGLPGWTLGAEAGNRPWTWTGADGLRREEHAVGASASVTKDWGWGWATGASLGADNLFDPGYQAAEFRLAPRTWVEWSRRSPGFSPVGPLVRLETTGVWPGSLVRFGADLRATFALGAGFKAAFRGVGMVQSDQYAPREALVLPDLGVRKVFDPSDRGRVAAWASAELRWQPPSADLGFTTATIEPALVADFGPGWAAGVALRAFFGAPVSLPLRLEVTFDQSNRFWLGFSASAPY